MSRGARCAGAVLLAVSAGVLPGAVSPARSAPPRAASLVPLSVIQGPAEKRFAARARRGEDAAAGERLVSVVVRLEDQPLASYDGAVPGLAAAPRADGRPDPSSPAGAAYLAYLEGKHRAFAAAAESAIPGAKLVHSYRVVLGGVSMILPESRVGDLAALPGVAAVYPDRLRRPDTEVSPQFIGADLLWTALGGTARAGEGRVVGVLDTGIWPEHPSLADPDAAGRPYPPPRTAPGANGFGSGGPRDTCDFGNTAHNPGDAPFACNNKLIGAYRFLDTYRQLVGLLPAEFDSARDDEGHGTHTATTAAGGGGVAAAVGGVPRGSVSGIAPRAHVVMYRVCAAQGCFDSDSARAVEQAILDGVEVINFSIGGGESPYDDAVSLAFLDAYNAGVFVAASAGNSGPGADTVAHREPWTTTVAASTAGRQFLSTVTLQAGNNADQLALEGASLTPGIAAPTPVVFPPAGREQCNTPFDPGTFSGEIVICERGAVARVAKGANVLAGGAGAMLLYNPVLQGTATDNHFLPVVHLESAEGAALLAFMGSHSGVTATFTPGTAVSGPGDVMAPFSSRGGLRQELGVSKPDVTAPGVQILAGNTPLPSSADFGPPGELFQAIQGTSMSSPHVAGAAALLKDRNPRWTPGQIKSALMTTAIAAGIVKEDGATPADPFDFGSGRVDLGRAGSPGLTISARGAELLAREPDLWNANLPSVYLPDLHSSIRVRRTARSHLRRASCWAISVDAPADLVVAAPSGLCVPARGSKRFTIAIDAGAVPPGEARHADVTLRSGARRLHLPVTVVRGEPRLTVGKSCDPPVAPLGARTDCALTLTNSHPAPAPFSLVDAVPRRLRIVRGSVSGGVQSDARIAASGTLAAAVPPDVSLAPGPAPAGYLPLSSLGVAPVAGVGDDTIVNYATAPFLFGGETYTTIGMTSNGFLVAGGHDDAPYVSQLFPDPEAPNNVLAPFWTDLNPPAGGALRAAEVSVGEDTWLVFDWERVRNYSNLGTNSFQAWIRVGAEEGVSFTYGPDITAGSGGYLTVGAENRFGSRGAMYRADGIGTLPTPSTELAVTTTPLVPARRVVTYRARGAAAGPWRNCAVVRSPLFSGYDEACVDGEVTPP